jgi:hypothetical protein
MSHQQAPSSSSSAPPFGIARRNLLGHARSRWRTTVTVVLLGAVLLLAFTGLLGGGAAHRVRAQAPELSGELAYDAIVRSGNWYETVLTVRAAREIQDLTIAVDDPLWRKMSIDTIAPDAESAEALDDEYVYHFGPAKAGESFRLKLDGQIQPGMLRRQTGAIRVRDDEREILAFPVSMTVLP